MTSFVIGILQHNLNKVGHGLHLRDPIFRAYSQSDKVACLMRTRHITSHNRSVGGRTYTFTGLGEPRAAAEHVHLQAGQVRVGLG